MMKPEEVHHIGRTLSRSETDSHRDPTLQSPIRAAVDEWDLVDANSTWFP